MSSVPEQRLKLTILSGFLGSGKTTWLRHQLHASHYRHAAVIVNEAAPAPVDDALLADLARLTVISGGCACCTKRDAFLACLRDLSDTRLRAGDAADFDSIILETSGLADPAAIVAAIGNDPMLVHHVVVDRVIVTVDAAYGLRSLQTDALARSQVTHADHLIVTKVDGIDRQTVATLCATLHALNPGAGITGAVMGVDVDLPDFASVPSFPLPELTGAGDARPVIAVDVDIDPSVDWTVFSVWLSALLHARGDDMYRIKGVVRTPAGRVLLQCVQKSVLQPQILPGSKEYPAAFDNRLAFIGRGFDPDVLRKSLSRFCGSH